jgi:hypothetical protein
MPVLLTGPYDKYVDVTPSVAAERDPFATVPGRVNELVAFRFSHEELPLAGDQADRGRQVAIIGSKGK